MEEQAVTNTNSASNKPCQINGVNARNTYLLIEAGKKEVYSFDLKNCGDFTARI
jgi:hypothetical protein